MILGITGSIGTGKTTVAKIFNRLGAKVIDADNIAHKLLKPKSLVYKHLVKEFGPGILNSNNSINRKALSKKAFSNKSALRKLCNITHPVIIKKIRKKVASIKRKNPKAIIAIDAPLLFEAKAGKMVDKIIVVATNKRVQIERAAKSLGCSKEEIKDRIKAQLPLKDKFKRTDFIIHNNSSLFDVKLQVKKIWTEVKKWKS